MHNWLGVAFQEIYFIPAGFLFLQRRRPHASDKDPCGFMSPSLPSKEITQSWISTDDLRLDPRYKLKCWSIKTIAGRAYIYAFPIMHELLIVYDY